MANQSTQYVLRIEHPASGCGPEYHFGPQGSNYIIPNSPPPIIDDVIDFERMCLKTHVCGVEYISHFFDWFGRTLQPLYDAGFKLYIYLLPVDKVLKCESGLQVAFNPADALEVTVL